MYPDDESFRAALTEKNYLEYLSDEIRRLENQVEKRKILKKRLENYPEIQDTLELMKQFHHI